MFVGDLEIQVIVNMVLNVDTYMFIDKILLIEVIYNQRLKNINNLIRILTKQYITTNIRKMSNL